MAQEPESPLDVIAKVLNGGDASVSDLATAIASVQSEIARVEGEIGHYREAVNQALVDLQDARTRAAQARNGTASARAELESAQVDVKAAQDKLDEISRSAYRRANTSDAVTNAAGGDARSAMLERQSYLHGQAAEQQATVDELERVRTDKANHESQLRAAEQLASDREKRAGDAEQAARATLEDSQSKVEEYAGKRAQLLDQEKKAESKLSEARGTGAGEDSVTTASKADTSQTKADTERQSQDQTPSQASSQHATEQGTSETRPSQQSSTSSPEGVGESVSGSEVPSAGAGATADAASPSSAGPTTTESTAPASAPAASQQLPQAGSSVNDGLQIAGAVLGAAAAIVAASQPDHTALASGDASTTTPGDGSTSSLSALQGGGDTTEGESDLVSQLDGVLDPLQTSSSITNKATQSLSNAGSDARIEAAIARAESQIGMPYAWGGGTATGPSQGIHDYGVADSFGDYNKVGFDCSGLTLYSFAAAGISLPHYTGYQYNQGTKVDPSQMKRGDLIFYGPGGGNHVAIYLGDGMMIEAPQSGGTVHKTAVRYGDMAPYAVRLIG